MARMDWDKARRAERLLREPTTPPKKRRAPRPGSFGSDMTISQRARFYARGAEVTVRNREVPPGT